MYRLCSTWLRRQVFDQIFRMLERFWVIWSNRKCCTLYIEYKIKEKKYVIIKFDHTQDWTLNPGITSPRRYRWTMKEHRIFCYINQIFENSSYIAIRMSGTGFKYYQNISPQLMSSIKYEREEGEHISCCIKYILGWERRCHYVLSWMQFKT